MQAVNLLSLAENSTRFSDYK